MIGIPQRICASGTPANPTDTPGDCFKCCVASILELPYEDVPHFVNREVTTTDLDGTVHALDWLTGVNLWLQRRGYPLHLKHSTNNLNGSEIRALRAERGLQPGEHLRHADSYHQRSYPDWNVGWWIASVLSENFEDGLHAIVMHDDEVAFDPSPFPRRTPYVFIGGKIFVCTRPAMVVRCMESNPDYRADIACLAKP